MTFPRRFVVTITVIAALLLAAVFFASLRYFLIDEAQRAGARLTLYRSTVIAEVDRFNHLTKVLAVDPFVSDALTTGRADSLDRRLAGFAEASGLDAIFLMDMAGRTISASNAATPNSFVGQNYAFRPYFQDAIRGETGTFYGIGATTGLPGYFIADPVRATDGSIIGVIAIKIDLIPFEQSWRDAGELVLLSNERGIVLLSSEATWRYRSLRALTDLERAQIREARQFAEQPLEPPDWSYTDGPRVRIDGYERLHLVSAELPHGWNIHYLPSTAQAYTLASLITGFVVVIAAAGLLVFQYVRGQRLNNALRLSEREEAALRRANEALAQEVEDRKRAERRLEKTREELARASRLAALGQLSASVTHELGQPIAAMRNHLAAAEISGTQTALSSTLADLVDRMAGITTQLKFFAKSGSEGFEDVDLRACVVSVKELMQTTFDEADTRLRLHLGDEALMVRGARLRIEQVLTNLLRNAIDATHDTCHPSVDVNAGQDTDIVWIEVSDNGHGLGDTHLDDLLEPFVTTRASGHGMGLGLAISDGILKDHGGHLEARNLPSGGAAFRVVLPRVTPSRDDQGEAAA
ncbi:sensor histidine kinase [Palleronia caenipelagi]|uniref:histidine kinase n=1 Tax=Palleronia caenipelagi TaxID=2489174 RepID=A0A547PTA5_9RHOB|nr:sensor histidine kinase [Palleronia caenipelagi]